MNFGVVIDALTQIIVDIVNFIPNLINGLIILVVGYAIAVAVRWLLGTILRRVRFDPLVERTGITGAIRGLGVRTPLSTVIAQTIFALLLISFLITSTRLMGLEAVALLLERLLLFLPNIIAALIVFLLGGIAAQFTGNLVTTLAIGGGLAYGARLGRLVQYLLSVFVVIFALGVLGIDTSILVTALTITLAAFGLAVGLSLGLGARAIVQHVLAGYYLRQRFAIGQRIVLGQIEGDLGGVGGVNTVLLTPGGATVVPNTVILESVVQAPQSSAGGEAAERI